MISRNPRIQFVHDWRMADDDGYRNLCNDLATALATSQGYVPKTAQERRAVDQMGGVTLRRAAEICCEHDGIKPPIISQPDKLFNAAVSTGSFPEILGNVAGKNLARGYEEYPHTFQLWAGVRQVETFREYKDIRLGAFSGMEKVNEAGEIAHGLVKENAETYTAETRGLGFSLTRRMLNNDDLQAFLRLPLELGKAAARDIDKLGYDLLISGEGLGPTMKEDSLPLFDATRGTPNLREGAGTALGDTGLGDAKTAMRKLQGLAGENLSVVPRFLLVPPELEQTALKLLHSTEIMVAGNTDTSRPAKNIHQGTLVPVVEPRLSAGTDGTTAWYLVADPLNAESLVVVFLGSERQPTIVRRDPENILGIGWIVYQDVGVAPVDWRGVQRNKGDA